MVPALRLGTVAGEADVVALAVAMVQMVVLARQDAGRPLATCRLLTLPRIASI